jgi:Protein of unknown function (DUF2800)
MNAPLPHEDTPAHSPFGGSVAARVLGCPASVGLVDKVPAHLRKSSAYADRGTALHAAMALLLDQDEHSLKNLVGETIGDYTITDDDIENALRPVCTCVERFINAPGAEYFYERRVVFPGVLNTFGTCDLIVRIGRAVHVVDYKFGTGVRVLALYPDGDEDVLNSQLMFYAAAARHSLPALFAGAETIVLTILQPVSIEPDAEMVSSVTVTHAELDEFITVYRAACQEALSESPRLARGAWCRFCAARPICPAHTGPLLDLARLATPSPGCNSGYTKNANPTPGGGPAKEAYLRALAAGLDLVDAVKEIRTVLHDQAKRALESGDAVPGYALTAGRAERHWHDESAALAALIDLGLARGDVIAETTRSPKQVELRAKARGLKIPPELIRSRRSGTSLVRSENARAPVPGRGEIVQSFARALEAFQGGGHS